MFYFTCNESKIYESFTFWNELQELSLQELFHDILIYWNAPVSYRSVGVKLQCAILCSIHVKHVILSHSISSKNNSRPLDCRSHDLVQHSLQILFPIGWHFAEIQRKSELSAVHHGMLVHAAAQHKYIVHGRIICCADGCSVVGNRACLHNPAHILLLPL